MKTTPRILAFSGSIRKGSLNQKALDVAIDGVKETGMDVTHINLRDYPLPIYDGDLEKESGIPENAMTLKGLFSSHQGLLIASPEYNSSITPLLKNTLDWISRPVKGEANLAPFVGKAAGLVSASPGALGGIRVLAEVRTILSNIKVTVLPDPVGVPKADQVFEENGKVKDPKIEENLKGVGKRLAQMVNKLSKE